MLLGIAVRTYALGHIPPGLNQDEASAGYEAWALLHHGIDRNGYHNPVHLVAWGSGQNALYSYLAMPFIAVFGLEVLPVRFVSWAVGILTLFVFHACVRRISGAAVALLALFVLAVSPWHIMLSRWALESNLLPGVFLCGVWLLVCAADRPWMLTGSFACFAVALYAYGSAYLVVPLFLVLSSGYLLYHRTVRLHVLAVAAATFVIVAAPIAWFVVINRFELAPLQTALFTIPRLTAVPRFTTVTSLFGDTSSASAIENGARFLRLLISQDDPRIFNQIPGFGYGYSFGPALALFGLLVAIGHAVRARGHLSTVFMLLWFVTGALLGAVYVTPNINRVNLLFLPMIFFTAVGIAAAARWLGARSRRVGLVLVGAVLVVYVLAFARFATTYFTEFPEQSSPVFFEGLGDAIRFAASGTDGPICVTGRANAPYIFVLFYTRADPKVFLSTARFSGPIWGIWTVDAFDRYTFGAANCAAAPREPAALVLHRSEAPSAGREGDVTRTFTNYVAVIRRQP